MKKGFTLIELIIVITILLILLTIAFLNFWNYVSEARDSVRISDLKNIEKALLLYEIKEWKFPEPDKNLENKEIFWENNFLLVKKLNKLPKDPKTQKEYFYEKIWKGFVLRANLENKNESFELFWWNLPKNCKEILQENNSLKNWKYNIFLNKQKIEVFCDMETPDENWDKWWTRYLNIKWNYSFEDAKSCWLWNIISNDKIDCFNPNRFEMRAEKFMAKQWENTYFYNNPEPEPSIDTEKINRYKCVWWKNYMTILSRLNDITNIENANIIRLWLTYCPLKNKVINFNWKNSWITNEKYRLERWLIYFNYWFDYKNTNKNPDSNAKLTEIYIK